MEKIQEYNGIKYQKVFDDRNSDSRETCIKKCCFCEKDDNGEYCCGNPSTKDFRFDGCGVGHFHWEKIK